VLVTPTVLQEVDSKKNHARLGDHARRFNKTLRPLLSGQSSLVVRANPAPRVEVALGDCGRVDWDQHPELDRDDPDSRIIAQALCARGPALGTRVVLSHDIRPLYLAQRHGLKIHQITDNWLRPKEISEAD
jgi:predicted ribonuclease YlaK